MGNSSYSLMKFGKDKPEVLLTQTGERFSQKITFSERLHRIVAVHQSQWEVQMLGVV